MADVSRKENCTNRTRMFDRANTPCTGHSTALKCCTSLFCLVFCGYFISGTSTFSHLFVLFLSFTRTSCPPDVPRTYLLLLRLCFDFSLDNSDMLSGYIQYTHLTAQPTKMERMLWKVPHSWVGVFLLWQAADCLRLTALTYVLHLVTPPRCDNNN